MGFVHCRPAWFQACDLRMRLWSSPTTRGTWILSKAQLACITQGIEYCHWQLSLYTLGEAKKSFTAGIPTSVSTRNGWWIKRLRWRGNKIEDFIPRNLNLDEIPSHIWGRLRAISGSESSRLNISKVKQMNWSIYRIFVFSVLHFPIISTKT